jgi:hypothetical protein
MLGLEWFGKREMHSLLTSMTEATMAASNNLLFCQQSSVEHAMVVRAQYGVVPRRVFAAFLPGYDVADVARCFVPTAERASVNKNFHLQQRPKRANMFVSAKVGDHLASCLHDATVTDSTASVGAVEGNDVPGTVERKCFAADFAVGSTFAVAGPGRFAFAGKIATDTPAKLHVGQHPARCWYWLAALFAVLCGRMPVEFCKAFLVAKVSFTQAARVADKCFSASFAVFCLTSSLADKAERRVGNNCVRQRFNISNRWRKAIASSQKG